MVEVATCLDQSITFRVGESCYGRTYVMVKRTEASIGNRTSYLMPRLLFKGWCQKVGKEEDLVGRG